MANSSRTSLLGGGRVISSSRKPDNETSADDQIAKSSAPISQDITAENMAHAIRFLAMDAVEAAQSGHPGMPMGTADIITVLFTQFINFDPHKPDWLNRDRFILSAGHGSMILYALFYLIGVEGVTIDDLKNFRQLGARTPGHPERGCLPGVEVTTGPLGQGLGMAVGMAAAERQLHHAFSHASDDIIDHWTYVLASDGDLMEGISHEAISLAGHLKLARLIVLHDSNEITIDGNINLAESGNVIGRFESANWHCASIDGHDPEAIASALTEARKSPKPSFISCQTKIGFGSPKEGSHESHGAALGEEAAAATRQKLDWNAAPFEVPRKILDAWRIAGLKTAKKSGDWQKKWDALPENIQSEITRRCANDLPDGISRALIECKRRLAREKNLATRKASGIVLDTLTQLLPEMIGGSADLTGSNNTKTAEQKLFSAENYGGQYIHYGVREHGMAAMMNGMAAHGGVLPYGGTFLVFSDYCRPSIRLSAMMGLRIIYVFTHDSIGLGEDGPTHQPVEHLAALRAIPGLNVFRPADGVETAECWDIAIRQNQPSAILLSRQNLRTLRNAQSEENRSRRGAYELRRVDSGEDATLIASGSEVALAVEARRLLAAKRVTARIVSVPCRDIFAAQADEYRQQILGDSDVRIVIEAASDSNWQRIAGAHSIFIGLNQYGASGKSEALFPHFGLTAEKIAETVLDAVEKNKEKSKK